MIGNKSLFHWYGLFKYFRKGNLESSNPVEFRSPLFEHRVSLIESKNKQI